MGDLVDYLKNKGEKKNKRKPEKIVA